MPSPFLIPPTKLRLADLSPTGQSGDEWARSLNKSQMWAAIQRSRTSLLFYFFYFLAKSHLHYIAALHNPQILAHESSFRRFSGGSGEVIRLTRSVLFVSLHYSTCSMSPQYSTAPFLVLLVDVKGALCSSS